MQTFFSSHQHKICDFHGSDSENKTFTLGYNDADPASQRLCTLYMQASCYMIDLCLARQALLGPHS